MSAVAPTNPAPAPVTNPAPAPAATSPDEALKLHLIEQHLAGMESAITGNPAPAAPAAPAAATPVGTPAPAAAPAAATPVGTPAPAAATAPAAAATAPAVPEEITRLIEQLRKENEAYKTQISTLTASVDYMASRPTIEKMVAARKARGMQAAELQVFVTSMYGIPVDQVEAIYNNERMLYASEQPQTNKFGFPSQGSQVQVPPAWTPPTTTQGGVPFNAQTADQYPPQSQTLGASAPATGADGKAKSLEELLA